jgi:hypothetical protein
MCGSTDLAPIVGWYNKYHIRTGKKELTQGYTQLASSIF